MTHYYDEDPAGSTQRKDLSFIARGRRFSANSAGGIFSKEGLDQGTAALLEGCIVPPEGSVLDLGCGWGAVGLVIKSLYPQITLTMSDVNHKALELAAENLKKARLEAEIVASDGFSGMEDRTFDLILTNPPYAAGRQTCYRLIEESFDHLAHGGTLQLVARHQKGGAMLERKMAEVFGNVDTLIKSGGFRVYRSIKNPQEA